MVAEVSYAQLNSFVFGFVSNRRNPLRDSIVYTICGNALVQFSPYECDRAQGTTAK